MASQKSFRLLEPDFGLLNQEVLWTEQLLVALPPSKRQTLWGDSDAEPPSLEDRVPTGFLALSVSLLLLFQT